MAIVATVGSALANSFVTIAEANTYFESRLNASAWDDAGEFDQEKALRMAAQRFQRENWVGSRVDSTQALAWPRGNSPIPDGVYVINGSGGYYLTTEIPQLVKDAQCELALWLLATNSQPGEQRRRVTQWSADGVSATFEYDGTIQTLPDEVSYLIGKLIRGVEIRRG